MSVVMPNIIHHKHSVQDDGDGLQQQGNYWKLQPHVGWIRRHGPALSLLFHTSSLSVVCVCVYVVRGVSESAFKLAAGLWTTNDTCWKKKGHTYYWSLLKKQNMQGVSCAAQEIALADHVSTAEMTGKD